MNEAKLKGLIEQMQDQFNELRANLARSDDVDDANIVAPETEKVTEIPDHHVEKVAEIIDHQAEEVTNITDHHAADLFHDSRSVWNNI